MATEVKVRVEGSGGEFPVDLEKGARVARGLLRDEKVDCGAEENGIDDNLEDIGGRVATDGGMGNFGEGWFGARRGWKSFFEHKSAFGSASFERSSEFIGRGEEMRGRGESKEGRKHERGRRKGEGRGVGRNRGGEMSGSSWPCANQAWQCSHRR